MKFGDFSPPSVPSLECQQDALRKGIGRARQWACKGRLADQPLLDACLRDQRFDVLVEEPRGDWLWWIIQDVGARVRFRVPILHALYELSDERSAIQLCQIAYHYANVGDESFRTRLYEIVEQKPIVDNPCLAEEEIVKLDGEQAFLFAARVRGKRLLAVEWDWDYESFAHDAVERFGEDLITGMLADSTDPAVKHFYQKWRQQAENRPASTQTYRDRMRSHSVDDIIEAAHGTDRCYWFRGWGMHADKAELDSILTALWASTEPQVITRLLRIFSIRSLPEFDHRLIDLCQHCDEDVRRSAFNALAVNADEAIRTFALQCLATEPTDSVISLFSKNFRCGDEERLLESITLPVDSIQLHWLLMDVIKVLESNPEADCSRLAVIAYGSTPCQNCRFYAARLLQKQEVAPEWLIEECRFDTEKDCRELFGGPASE